MIKKFLLLIALLGITAGAADAETAGIVSALTWRADDTADYRLDAYSAPGIYRCADVIALSADLAEVTVSWQSTGTVRLELSCDGGIYYVPLVNGMPLSPCPAGRRLVWRAELADDSVLTGVTVTYRDQQGIVAGFGCPELSGFAYRKPIVLRNGQAEVSNCQLLIRVATGNRRSGYDVQCDEKVQRDFRDIRFTTADGQTVLPHWIESNSHGVAMCWIRVPQIPAGESFLYIYYGNRDAPDRSDAAAVFDFYDDFGSSTLTAGQWNSELQAGGAVQVSAGRLSLKNALIRSQDFMLGDGIIEYGADTHKQVLQVIVRSDPEQLDINEQMVSSSDLSGAEHCIAVGSTAVANDPHPPHSGMSDYRVIANGSYISFKRFAVGSDKPEAGVKATVADGIRKGHIAIRAIGSGECLVDWIRVRRYTGQPIAVSARDAAAEQVQPPQFDGLVVNNRAELTMREGAAGGTYQSQVLPLSLPARIAEVDWRAELARASDVRVDLSLNGGTSFVSDCIARKKYYATEYEFGDAQSVVARIRLTADDARRNTVQAISLLYSPGKVVLYAPNGGETLASGQQYTIRWNAADYAAEYLFRLAYSADGGRTFETIAAEVPNTGWYRWEVSRQPSDAALIKISDAAAEKVQDVSDRQFRVSAEAEAAPDSEPAAAPSTGAEPEADVSVAEAEQTAEPNREETAAEQADLLQLYDVAIKVGDNENKDSVRDTWCYKDGDIVLVRPAGQVWGARELEKFMVVQMELTPEQARQLTETQQVPGSDAHVSRRRYQLDMRQVSFREVRKSVSGALAGFGGRGQSAKKLRDLSPQERRILRQKRWERTEIKEK